MTMTRAALLSLCLWPAAAWSADGEVRGEPLDQVLLRVKQEIGLYQNESATWRETRDSLFRQRGLTPQCGNGDINFVLKEVKMEFTAALDTTDKGNIGLKVPFGSVAAGASVSGSKGERRTQTLTYTYYVPPQVPPDPQFRSVLADQAVILPTLAALRDSLILATTQKPCMMNTPPDRDNSFTFALELTASSNKDVGFTCAVVDAGAGAERQARSGNTITVTFHPTPTSGGGRPR